jgi:hypothetical protein
MKKGGMAQKKALGGDILGGLGGAFLGPAGGIIGKGLGDLGQHLLGFKKGGKRKAMPMAMPMPTEAQKKALGGDILAKVGQHAGDYLQKMVSDALGFKKGGKRKMKC